MASPSVIHQSLSIEISSEIRNYIKSNKGDCKVFTAPFDVVLKNDNENCETFSYDIDDNKINIQLLNNNDEDYIIPYYYVDLYESSTPTLVLSYVLDGIQVDYHLIYGC